MRCFAEWCKLLFIHDMAGASDINHCCEARKTRSRLMNAARRLSDEDLRAVAALKASSHAENADDRGKAAKDAAVEHESHTGAGSR